MYMCELGYLLVAAAAAAAAATTYKIINIHWE